MGGPLPGKVILKGYEMTDEMENGANERTTSRLLPVLLLLFVGSGCAALIYEIV